MVAVVDGGGPVIVVVGCWWAVRVGVVWVGVDGWAAWRWCEMVYVGLIVGGWWTGGVRRYSVGGDGVLSGRTIGRVGLRSAAGLGCGGIDGWEVHFHGGL